jgi:predicted transposase YbfD/YdcC
MLCHTNTEHVRSFVEVLTNELPDLRDNRGKRHSLVVVIVAFVLATLRGRSTLSGIHRFMVNFVDRLHELTRTVKTRTISRAHLPRLLARLDWSALDQLIERYFGLRISQGSGTKVWVAIDGKTLRGTLHGDEKQSLVLAVTHETREVIGQARQMGSKSSEIPVTRTLLQETGLDKQKVSLDAHHCNPKTTTQIQDAGGVYLTQVKENQEVLLKQCQSLAQTQPIMAEVTQADKGHGRVTTRHAKALAIESTKLDPRWKDSGISTCVVVERETFEATTRKTTFDTSYYISNQAIHTTQPETTVEELAQAVRSHWGVESDNWIRDVTFKEDSVKTRSGNQAQIMGRLRSLSMALIRKTSPKNFQAAIDRFADSFSDLELALRKANFL